MSSPPGEEIEDLAAELNRGFYANRPSDYFRQRLFSLLLTTTKAEELGDVIKGELTYGPVRMLFPADQDSDEETQAFLDRFLVLESEILLHHVTEVLLRLALAHEGSPACPWVELVENRDFAGFKRRVETEFVIPSPNQIDLRWSRVFLGSTEPLTPPEVESDKDWDDCWTSIARILQLVTNRYLQHSNIYNATKHGFGLVTGSASFSMAPDAEGRGFNHEGFAVEHLKRGRHHEGVTAYERTITWIEPTEGLILSFLAVHLMESMWNVARWRYQNEETLKIYLLPGHELDKILKSIPHGLITHLSRKFTLVKT